MIKEISDAAVHYNRIVTAQIHFGEEGSLPTKEQESINDAHGDLRDWLKHTELPCFVPCYKVSQRKSSYASFA